MIGPAGREKSNKFPVKSTKLARELAKFPLAIIPNSLEEKVLQ